jgi:transposase
MVNHNPMYKAGDGDANGAKPLEKRSAVSRANTSRPREFDDVQVFKTVSEREPRRLNGNSPNSRLSRRQIASSHLQVRDKTMSEPIYVGIDVSKDSFHLATSPNILKTSLPNTSEGHSQLSKILKDQTVALIVLEATGGYERPIAAELLSESFPVVVVNPRQVRDFAKGMGQLAKTDLIDAAILAQFAQIVKPAPRTHSTPQTAELTEMVRRRRQLNDLRTQESNRLVTICNRQVKNSIHKMIKTLDKQIAQIDKLIREHIDSDDDFKAKDQIIQSTPGVGPQTSAMLIANLPELGSLNRQQIAAMAGLAPWDCSSGKYDGKAHIFGGRKDVRTVLYMAAFNACRFNPAIRQLHHRLTRKGKPYKVVLTACMRKLLVILNTMIRNQTLWTPEIS